jgi:hypothetical protein
MENLFCNKDRLAKGIKALPIAMPLCLSGLKIIFKIRLHAAICRADFEK